MYVAMFAALIVAVIITFYCVKGPVFRAINNYSNTVNGAYSKAYGERNTAVGELLASEQKLQGKDRDIFKMREQFQSKIDSITSNVEMQKEKLQIRIAADLKASSAYLKERYNNRFQKGFLEQVDNRVKSLDKGTLKELNDVIVEFVISDLKDKGRE